MKRDRIGDIALATLIGVAGGDHVYAPRGSRPLVKRAHCTECDLRLPCLGHAIHANVLKALKRRGLVEQRRIERDKTDEWIATVHAFPYALLFKRRTWAAQQLEHNEIARRFREGARKWVGWLHANDKAVQLLVAHGLEPDRNRLIGAAIAEQLCIALEEGREFGKRSEHKLAQS